MIRYYILIACMFCTFTLSSQEKDKVVIESSYGNDIPQNVRDIFMTALSSGLTNSGRFIVLTNREEYMAKLSGELQAQDAGYIDDKQMLELGRASGADYVVYARINLFEDEFFITFQMTELKTGISVKVPEPIITSRSGLLRAAKNIAVRLASGDMNAGEDKAIPKNEIVCLGCIVDSGIFVDGLIDNKDRDAVSWDEAITICRNKGEGWRLPTVDELKAIYRNRRTLIDTGSRHFQPTTYWTSSARNNFSVYSLDFSDASQTYISKSSQYTFRCVHSR